jgi:hypothetical protein
MRGKSFRKKVSSAQVTPPSYPTGVGKGARVVVGSNRSDRAALHPKAEIRGNTAASDRQSRSIAATWSRLRMRAYIFIALPRL